MPIQTNRIEAKIEYSKLDSIYDFFVVMTTEQYIKGGAKILDVPSLDNKVQSIVFISGKNFYFMMIKDISNKTRLKNLLYSNHHKHKTTPNGKSHGKMHLSQ